MRKRLTPFPIWKARLEKSARLGPFATLALAFLSSAASRSERVFIFNDRGELILARLSGAGYQELGRAALLKPTYPYGGRNVARVPPAYANRCVFARSDQELVCASLAAGE